MGEGQGPMESCFKAKLWSEGQTGGGSTKEKAPQEAAVRVDRVRDEKESGKKSKGRWSGGGRPGESRFVCQGRRGQHVQPERTGRPGSPRRTREKAESARSWGRPPPLRLAGLSPEARAAEGAHC